MFMDVQKIANVSHLLQLVTYTSICTLYQLPVINNRDWYLNAKEVFWFWYSLGFPLSDTTDGSIRNKLKY